MSQEKTIV